MTILTDWSLSGVSALPLEIDLDDHAAAALDPALLDADAREALWSAAPEPWAAHAHAVAVRRRADAELRDAAAAQSATAARDHHATKVAAGVVLEALLAGTFTGDTLDRAARDVLAARTARDQAAAAHDVILFASRSLPAIVEPRTVSANAAQWAALVAWLDQQANNKRAAQPAHVYAVEYARLLDHDYPSRPKLRGSNVAPEEAGPPRYFRLSPDDVRPAWAPAVAVLDEHYRAQVVYGRALLDAARQRLASRDDASIRSRNALPSMPSSWAVPAR